MPDTLFVNGTVLTMDESSGLYAQALLVRDGAVAAVGPRSALEAQSRGAEVVDLHGAAVMPAFIDAHSHLSSYAMGLQQVPLEGARDFDEIVSRIQRYIKDNQIPAGQWVTAHGYDHNYAVDGPAGTLRPAARAWAPATGIGLEVRTTLPGVQLYTANGLEAGCPGKGGAVYGPHQAFCLETQFYPDSPNQPAFPSCVLRAGERYDHTTRFCFTAGGR